MLTRLLVNEDAIAAGQADLPSACLRIDHSLKWHFVNFLVGIMKMEVNS